jgi:hypothetical protein
MTTVSRGRSSSRRKRPPASRTTETRAVAGISGRIVPSGVSSVARENDASRNRIVNAIRGWESAVAPAATAPAAVRAATRMEGSPMDGDRSSPADRTVAAGGA